jgi:hypothetical protein
MSRIEQPPLEAESCLEHFPTHIPIQVAKCNLRTTRLGADAHVLFENYAEDDSISILKLLQLLKTGISIELDNQDWAEAETGPYGYRRVRKNSPSFESAAVKAPQLEQHDYNDIWMAHICNPFRGGRIHLHKVLLHCIGLICTHPIAVVLSHDLTESKGQSQSMIIEMVSEICASTSFSIGSADCAGPPPATEGIVPLGGYFLNWPLLVRINSCESGSEIELLMEDQWTYISDVLGSRVAGKRV